jgi:hypothetical protein
MWMSQHCDIHATRQRHRAGNVECMTSNRIAAASLTVLTALVAVSLSACSIAVTDPESTTPPPASPSPTTAPGDDSDDSDETINGGAFTDGACDGRDVEVSQDSTVVVLSGQCGVVNVTATGTTVNLVDADSVIVTGTDNTIIVEGAVGAVTITSDSNFFSGDAAGSVKVEGNENDVALNTADEVRLTGDSNFVQWSYGATAAEDTGFDNFVIAASAE